MKKYISLLLLAALLAVTVPAAKEPPKDDANTVMPLSDDEPTIEETDQFD